MNVFCISFKFTVRVFSISFIVACLLSCKDNKRNHVFETELQPIIARVDTFINERHRLPDYQEFQGMSGDGNFTLRNRMHKYARSKGATHECDYMVGVWRGEWLHYYKSWDHSFLNGSDEPYESLRSL